MATAEHIKGLLRSYIAGDGEQFLTISMQVAAHEARRGNTNLAREIRELIDAAKLRAAQPVRRPAIPLARPVGELADLIDVSYPKTRIADMVLADLTRASLDRVLTEYRQQDKLRTHGLSARRKLLLVGPPGSGKTMTASALAGELSQPLLVVRLDGVITKYLGETAAKIRLIFESMILTRGVYLFDEFDAIGSDRARPNDIGEIRRVLNSFLQFLEGDDSDSLILAATNHRQVLDPALFRRFDDVIRYGLPGPEHIELLLKNRLNAFDLHGLCWGEVRRAATGLSFADVARAANEAAKRAVLEDRAVIRTEHLVESLGERTAINANDTHNATPPMTPEKLPHLVVDGFFGTEKYTAAPRKGPDFQLPARDRTSHGTAVQEQLNKIRDENEVNRGVQASPDRPTSISIEVRGEPGFLLKLESLENRSKGIVVANSRIEGNVPVAAVQVPEGAFTHFLKLAEQYLTEETRGTAKSPAKPKNQELIAGINQVRLVTIRSYWTDPEADFPQAGQAIWWEVWVLVLGDQSPWDSFRMLARVNGLETGSDSIRFPDRVVGLAYGTAEQLMASAELLDMIGEVRRAKENPAEFVDFSPKDQADWVNGLLSRITPPTPTAPAVCLLDAGVVANPLVQPALSPEDCHRFDPNWPLADNPMSRQADTHGTEMAGAVLYGMDLATHLGGNERLQLTHHIESVRVLPPRPRENERRLYGYITAQAIARVESANPHRRRSFCMAITTDGRDLGRPSSWSGVIDQQCAGISDSNPRLFLISAGNTDPNQRHRSPDSNDTDHVQDPAQAWNAVTVGAYTSSMLFNQEKYSGFTPIAMLDDISPCSTTSVSWEPTWPYKPDIVLEGGNQIVLPGTSTVMGPEEMGILTAAHATEGRLLVEFRDTSAATAQAARMAAILQAEYPDLWPETVRALLVHSAEWTEPMKSAFGANKGDAALRLRRYGYGVPSLSRALYSARSSLTLITQQTIQPFTKDEGDVKTKDMGLHSLPWPKEQLLELSDQQVIMRVTLSYFIEPKPGRRDGFATARHRYQSHGLRFEVKRPQESLDDLKKRVSRAARDEEEKYQAVGDTAGWTLGPQIRTRGSIHSDWWTGTAADLANCGFVVVYPVSGWWRESKGNHWSKEARYALIVSIRTGKRKVDLFSSLDTPVDFYTPVETTIKAAVRSTVEAEIPVSDTSSGEE